MKKRYTFDWVSLLAIVLRIPESSISVNPDLGLGGGIGFSEILLGAAAAFPTTAGGGTENKTNTILCKEFFFFLKWVVYPFCASGTRVYCALKLEIDGLMVLHIPRKTCKLMNFKIFITKLSWGIDCLSLWEKSPSFPD